MAHVELNELVKEFDDVTAVDGISLDIPDESFTVLVGPSGCGKTTTLRLIAGLERATDGEIRIGDEVVNDQRAYERDIAMVFQNYALYPHKTVRENMRFGLEQHDTAEDIIQDRVSEAAELLQIEELLERRPAELSGGQQQRVALGRAIVRDPAVFLMDEPLSNLDAKLRVQMRAELNKLHDELSTTTVYVTHDQVEAMSLADRICVLRDGSIQQVGPPREVFERPQNKWVAGFMGSPPMNFLPGTYTAADGGAIVGDAFEYSLDAHTNLEANDGEQIDLGARPKDFDVLDEPAEHTIPASIVTVEPTGERSILTVQIGANTLKVEVDDNEAYENAEGVEVFLKPTKTYVYGADEQLRSMASMVAEVKNV